MASCSRRPAFARCCNMSEGSVTNFFVAFDGRVKFGQTTSKNLGDPKTDAMSQPARISDPAFLGGVLDHILGHEPDLLDFAAAADIDPTFVLRARATLPGVNPDW